MDVVDSLGHPPYSGWLNVWIDNVTIMRNLTFFSMSLKLTGTKRTQTKRSSRFNVDSL